VLNSSAAVITDGSSSARAGNSSAHGGWGLGSEVTTHALSARHFNGARLSTPYQCAFEKVKNSVNKQSESEDL
jgi:hypothetical protein